MDKSSSNKNEFDHIALKNRKGSIKDK